MIDPRAVADQLLVARRERKAIAPFSDEHPDLDVTTAYEVQAVFVESLVEAGERIVGAKVGVSGQSVDRATKVLKLGVPELVKPVILTATIRDRV